MGETSVVETPNYPSLIAAGRCPARAKWKAQSLIADQVRRNKVCLIPRTSTPHTSCGDHDTSDGVANSNNECAESIWMHTEKVA